MLLMAKALCVCLAELFIYDAMSLYNSRNKESLSKTTSNPLDKTYLGTMKCVFVGKAFKNVAVEQTKFKQIKR